MSEIEALRQENDELRRRLAELGATANGTTGERPPSATGTEYGVLRAAQEKLAERERLFRSVFDGALDAMLLADDRGIYVDANPAACELFALSREQMVERSIGDLIGAPTAVDRAWGQVLREGRLVGQFTLARHDGSRREVDVLLSASVAPGLHLAVLRDITERRRAETRFMAMIEKSHDGIGLSDRLGNTIYMSPAVQRTVGRSPLEVEGASGFEHVHPDDLARLATILADVVARPTQPVSYEIRVLHVDGSIHWMEATATNFLDDPAIGAICTNFRDITERKSAEDERNRLAAIVESSDDAIISNDLEGLVTSWNRGAEQLFQWSAAEAVGKHIDILTLPDLRDDDPRIRNDVHGHDVVHRFDTKCIRRDRSVVEVALTVSPIRDSNGRIVGASKIARDLTESRKEEAKLRRTEEQFRQVQKMDAVGTLAAGLAHDFNNLLSVILGYATLVQGELNPSDPLRADVEEIARAGERATGLTRQLLAFSRQQINQPRVVALDDVVGGMERMLGRLLGEDIELVLTTDPSAGRVLADPSQIEQIVMNLAVNARDAMPRGGKLSIELHDTSSDVSSALERGIAPGSYVVLTVTDTGCGMDRVTCDRIFEPFFTTKEVGKGTGLGLSTVFGIVTQSRGHVAVASEPGRGTTFRVSLPRVAQEVAAAPASSASEALGGSETILLVEDDPQVRVMMRAILSRHGYEVLDAQNAGEAFLACDETANIHLLLTDVVMPRMSGHELAQRLARAKPEMRVLYVTGHPESNVVRRGVVREGHALLQKPITPSALLRKVREVLYAPPAMPSAARGRAP